MLVSILTDEIHQDPQVFLPFLRERGLKFAEIRMVRGRRYPDLDPRDKADLPARLEEAGLEVSALSPGLFKGPAGPGGQRMKESLEGLFPRALDEAGAFHCRRILVFAPDRDPDLPPGPPFPGWLLENFIHAADLARERGLTLFLENEPGSWADTGPASARLLEVLGHPSLRANWDPANALFAGEEKPWEEGFSALAPFVGHVHVKDALPPGGGGGGTKGQDLGGGGKGETPLPPEPAPPPPRFTALGEGAMDWPAQLEALKNKGYRGFLTLETHCEPLSRTTPESLDRLERMLAALSPAGGEG